MLITRAFGWLKFPDRLFCANAKVPLITVSISRLRNSLLKLHEILTVINPKYELLI